MKTEITTKGTKMKIKIQRNQWGNINAYIGGKKVKEFGLDINEARNWLFDIHQEEREQLEIKQNSEIHHLRTIFFLTGATW